MALLLGTKFRSWMILRMRGEVSSVTRFEPLMTRETVALDTPAILAISRMLMDMGSPIGLDGSTPKEVRPQWTNRKGDVPRGLGAGMNRGVSWSWHYGCNRMQ